MPQEAPNAMTTSSQIPAGPPQADIDALRDLLDLTASFTDNDQRARYLLTSNWMQSRQIDARTEILAQLVDMSARLAALEKARG
jgi:hypothetical protein